MRPPQKSGVVVPNQLKWHGKLAAFAIYVLIRALSCTWRFREMQPLGTGEGPVIFAIWHNRLATCMKIYTDIAQRIWPTRGLAALISASSDGALLARVLEYFGVTPARGSSSRRGRQALLELTRQLEAGLNVAITPDGPKGPKYRAQSGVIALAQITGAPIIPSAMRVSSKWTLRSWDGFQIPKPFARCDLFVAEPLRVPREADETQREELRAELERRLMSITFD